MNHRSPPFCSPLFQSFSSVAQGFWLVGAASWTCGGDGSGGARVALSDTLTWGLDAMMQQMNH